MMLRLSRLSSYWINAASTYHHNHSRHISTKESFQEVTDESFEKEVLHEKDKAVMVDFYAK
jgi:thioredoxin-like negative regulator of GroEL